MSLQSQMLVSMVTFSQISYLWLIAAIAMTDVYRSFLLFFFLYFFFFADWKLVMTAKRLDYLLSWWWKQWLNFVCRLIDFPLCLRVTWRVCSPEDFSSYQNKMWPGYVQCILLQKNMSSCLRCLRSYERYLWKCDLGRSCLCSRWFKRCCPNVCMQVLVWFRWCVEITLYCINDISTTNVDLIGISESSWRYNRNDRERSIVNLRIYCWIEDEMMI